MPIPVYPLDLTGNALTNHIVGEVRAITSNIERFIVPVGGPFYTVTMVVRNNVTNAILLPNTQYKILHHIPEASQDSGKNVCAVVYITDATVPAVRLEYQVVGGQYQNMVPLIAQLISEHPLDPNAPDQIGWGQIFGMPNQYPPTAHIHPANQFLGYADLVMALENLRVAVANGDNLAISAIYRYIELMFSSSQYVTADQLNSLLITPEPFVKVHPTYAALKQRDDMVANLAVVYATIGRAQSNDGLGMLFRWDSLSTATPDEKYILRPNHILGNDPGRFISLSWTQNVLDRHGIDAAVAAFSMVPDNVDLDTLKTPSKMWVRNNQINRPFDYGVLEITLVGGTIDVPAEVHQRMYWDHREATRNCNHLGVWSVWTFVKSRFLAIERNLSTNAVDLDTVVEPNDYYYGDGCSNHPTQYGLLNVRIETHDIVYHIAHGSNNTVHTRYRANNGTWTRWKKLMDEVEMERHGINTAIALHNQLAVNVNLDNVLTPGKFYIGNHTEPSPGLHGILEVELISGTLDAPGEAEQTFKRSSSTSLFATRRRYWNGTTHVWDQWMFRAMRNGETDQVFHAAAPAIGTEQGTHVVNIAMQNVAFTYLWNVLHRYGIEYPIAAHATQLPSGVDLDTWLLPGKYWVTNSEINRAFDYGILEVEVIGGPLQSPGEVHQRMYFDNREAMRSRHFGGTWSNWFYVASKSDVALSQLQSPQCNLGLVVQHYATNSIVLPAYIGEDPNASTITIFISGRLATINVNDIGHLTSSDIVSTYAYIYLYETSPGVFSLGASTTAPKKMSDGNMTTQRHHLPNGLHGGDYLTSTSVFIGIAVCDVFEAGQPQRWAYVRNWFQDPGAVELIEYGTYDSSNVLAATKITGPVVRLNFDDDLHLTPPKLSSDYFNKYLSYMKFLAWEGEEIDLDFFTNYSLQHSGAGLYGMTLDVIVAYDSMAGSFGVVPKGIRRLNALTPGGVANAWTNGYKQTIGFSHKIVAPVTGLYSVQVEGGQSPGAVGWLAGHKSQGVEQTTMTAKLNAVHHYRGLNIARKFVPGQVLTVTIPSGDYYNIDMYDFFVNQHGPIANYPNLMEIIFVTESGVIGSTSVNGASVFFSTNFPSSVLLRLRNYATIVGIGGYGGNNSGTRDGGPGGHAIVSHRLLLVENYGIIGGGGGGGGGGGSGSSGATGSDGGTGGGGAGRYVGQAGNRYRGPTGDGNDREGGLGQSGTLTTGGEGGISYYAGPRNSNFSQGGYGGRGGDLGQNGTAGENGRIASVADGGAGGIAGRAIRSFHDVWLVVQGDIRGQIDRYI